MRKLHRLGVCGLFFDTIRRRSRLSCHIRSGRAQEVRGCEVGVALGVIVRRATETLGERETTSLRATCTCPYDVAFKYRVSHGDSLHNLPGQWLLFYLSFLFMYSTDQYFYEINWFSFLLSAWFFKPFKFSWMTTVFLWILKTENLLWKWRNSMLFFMSIKIVWELQKCKV